VAEKIFRLPDDTHRLFVVGRTGSGKTVFANWVLSKQPFDEKPWVVVDYKRDPLLNSIDRVREIGLDTLPGEPGLYRINPRPVVDDDAVEDWLLSLWATENVGLYVDEVYMLPNRAGFQGILTQGRSKRIPAIVLAQRPAWLSRFVLSEADFFAAFHLNHKRDRQTIEECFPYGALNRRLPDYCCYWYDVGQNCLFDLKPVPDPAVIAESINDRLRPKRRWV
jgi:hypothetical protein